MQKILAISFHSANFWRRSYRRKNCPVVLKLIRANSSFYLLIFGDRENASSSSLCWYCSLWFLLIQIYSKTSKSIYIYFRQFVHFLPLWIWRSDSITGFLLLDYRYKEDLLGGRLPNWENIVRHQGSSTYSFSKFYISLYKCEFPILEMKSNDVIV